MGRLAGELSEHRLRDKTRLLRNHFLLQHLSQSDLERIAAAATWARFGRNEKIFRRGENETDLMIMMDGRGKLSVTSTDGKHGARRRTRVAFRGADG